MKIHKKYLLASKAYRLYNHLNGKISIKRDVVFAENASWDFCESNEMVQEVPMFMKQVPLLVEVPNEN